MNKNLFRKVIQEIADKGDYMFDRPRSFFIKAINLYKKKGGQINLDKRLFSDYIQEERLFIKILDDLKIPIKKGVLAELRIVNSSSPSVVTQTILAGARGNEIRQRGILGNDY